MNVTHLLLIAFITFVTVLIVIEEHKYTHRLPEPDTSGQSSSMSGIGNQ